MLSEFDASRFLLKFSQFHYVIHIGKMTLVTLIKLVLRAK
jgi:hypothetical protein